MDMLKLGAIRSINRMKMKVFDIHAHIYPEKIADKAVHSISALYGGFEMKGDGVRKR